MRFLLLLFIGTPLIEMWLLIEVGRIIGAPLTILAVATTAMLGLALLKRQGVDTLTRANERLSQGQLPASEIFEGLLLAVGGALLLTPGFVTDALGFSCLLPFSRKAWAGMAMRQFAGGIHFGAGFDPAGQGESPFENQSPFIDDSHSTGPHHRPHDRPRRPGNAIEGEFRREDD